jgi:hypothetical protein
MLFEALGDPHIDVIGDFGAAVAPEQDRAPDSISPTSAGGACGAASSSVSARAQPEGPPGRTPGRIPMTRQRAVPLFLWRASILDFNLL